MDHECTAQYILIFYSNCVAWDRIDFCTNMSVSKQLKNLLLKNGIEETTVDEQLDQRASSNINSYIRLINYRLMLSPCENISSNNRVSELLHFIHRQCPELHHTGRNLIT